MYNNVLILNCNLNLKVNIHVNFLKVLSMIAADYLLAINICVITTQYVLIR